jgi:hypothetical protein
MKITTFIFVIFGLIANWEVQAQSNYQKELKDFPAELIVDKIRGGLLGQILGNLNGFQYEGKFNDEPGNVLTYTPALPDGARTDDDTDFEWVYIYEMQKKRNAFFTPDDITDVWKERMNRGVYNANAYARHLMDMGIKPPVTGFIVFNPWAGFNVSGQFLSETFGLIAPAMPQTAAKIGLNYTTVAIDNEPAQTTQLFTTMIATAFFESDIHKILDAGMAALDKKSIIVKITEDVKKWHVQYPEDWRTTRRLLKEKYSSAEGGLRDGNGHELNTGAIIAALLYGNGNFEKTLLLSFNLGWDADCNAATVGTIIGVIKGYRDMLNHNDPEKEQWQIVDRYSNTRRNNMPMNETITSFADRIVDVFEMINESNGGKKAVVNNTVVYQIPVEKPALVRPLFSVAEQTENLKKELGDQIKEDILRGDREGRARAAYMAICLDMGPGLAKSHSRQWKAACYDLRGYWKVMNNVYSHEFNDIKVLQNKFEKAGFSAPEKIYKYGEMANDSVYWRAPSGPE